MMDDYEVVRAPLADEYLNFMLVGGPLDHEYARIHEDATWYEAIDDDYWVVRYERHTYDYGSGHKRTVFIYVGKPQQDQPKDRS